MRIRKIIIVLISAIAILIALTLLLIGIASYANFTVPLENVRQQFIKKATELTGKEIQINGEIRLAISFYPTLVVDQLQIVNEPGWSAPVILSVGEARVQLALPPLLSGQIEFLDISASSIRVNLEQAADGRKSWASFIQTESNIDDAPSKTSTLSNDEKKFWIEEFSLTDLSLHYIDNNLGREFNNHIDKLVINTKDKSYLTATVEGKSEETPYLFSVKSGLLRTLASNKPWSLELKGQIAGKPANLEFHLQQSDPVIEATVKFDAQEVDIGKTFSWLGLVEGLDANSSNLTFNAVLQGSTLKEILEQSNFKVELGEVHWNLHIPANEKSHKVTFSTARLSSEAGNPVKLEFTGMIEDQPLQLKLSSNKISDFFTEMKKTHLDLTTTFNHSLIKINGDIDLPISEKTLIVDLEINGKRLDNWNKLLGNSIPPFGPYHLSGKLSIDPKGFRFNDLKTRIGDSDLGGEVFVDTSGSKAHWELNLISQNFQINDFEVEGFSFFPETNNTTSTPDRKGDVKPFQQGLNKGFQESRDHPKIDASLHLEARQVLSGRDKLGGGTLQLRASENALTVDTFNLDIPGGSIAGALDLQQHGKEIEGQLKLNMDRFDYGILYRRFKPDSPADGLISARVDLQLSGSDFMHGLDHANGQLDFAVWPGNIDASAINLWSVNLFLAILPELNKKESKLNCTTALLDINDGQLSEELIFVDTSKIWMNGNFNVDFPAETLSLSLFPTAKKARIFGLQAPMRVKGTFSEINVTIKPFDIVSTYFKFITSPLHAPFRRAFGKKAVEDMSELCGELLDREKLKAIMKEYNEKTPTLDEMYDF